MHTGSLLRHQQIRHARHHTDVQKMCETPLRGIPETSPTAVITRLQTKKRSLAGLVHKRQLTTHSRRICAEIKGLIAERKATTIVFLLLQKGKKSFRLVFTGQCKYRKIFSLTSLCASLKNNILASISARKTGYVYII